MSTFQGKTSKASIIVNVTTLSLELKTYSSISAREDYEPSCAIVEILNDDDDDSDGVIVEAVHLKFSTPSALLSISPKSHCIPPTDRLPAKL